MSSSLGGFPVIETGLGDLSAYESEAQTILYDTKRILDRVVNRPRDANPNPYQGIDGYRNVDDEIRMLNNRCGFLDNLLSEAQSAMSRLLTVHENYVYMVNKIEHENKKKIRFVRLQKKPDGFVGEDRVLSVSQVVARDSTGVNIAKHKPTLQSSDYGHGQFPSSHATDGNPETFTHTRADDPIAWLEVDLQHSYDLRQVTIFNRQDFGRSRIINTEVCLLNHRRQVLKKVTIKDSAPKFEFQLVIV